MVGKVGAAWRLALDLANHVGQSFGSRIAGIRSCSSAIIALAFVVKRRASNRPPRWPQNGSPGAGGPGDGVRTVPASSRNGGYTARQERAGRSGERWQHRSFDRPAVAIYRSVREGRRPNSLDDGW